MTTRNPEEGRESTSISDTLKQQLKDANDKLSSEHLGQAAQKVAASASDVVGQVKHAVSDVRQDADSLLHDARDAATDSYRTAREYALESAHELSERARRVSGASVDYARRAGSSTADFVASNALPLTLIGAGVGWLAWSLRRRGQSEAEHTYRVEEFDEGLEGEYPIRERGAAPSAGASGRLDGLVSGAREIAGQAKDGVGSLAARATQSADAVRSRVTDAASHWGEQASELSQEAREQLRAASLRTRDFADENPLIVGAIAIAAGVGVGLLLPHTKPEDRLLGQTRDRLLGDARGLLQDARETARETAGQLGQRARDTAQELRGAVSDSRISH